LRRHGLPQAVSTRGLARPSRARIGGFLGAVWGLFRHKIYWLAGSGAPGRISWAKLTRRQRPVPDKSGAQMPQPQSVRPPCWPSSARGAGQARGRCCAVFAKDAKEENEGLDRVAHGEVARLGNDLDGAAERPTPEPRPATMPPDGQGALNGADRRGTHDERLIRGIGVVVASRRDAAGAGVPREFNPNDGRAGQPLPLPRGRPATMRDKLMKTDSRATWARAARAGKRRPQTRNGHSRVPA